MSAFEHFFRSEIPSRDKYLARLFALFSERIVHAWCACPESPYEDLGRPTLCDPGQVRGSTIDFTLRHGESGKTYAAELKCELEYDNYRYLRLIGADQLRHHTSTAFERFLRVAKHPTACDVRLRGKPQFVDGAILIWGAVAPEGRDLVIAHYGFADVLSIEAMLVDLHNWEHAEWAEFVGHYSGWTNELYSFLAGTRPDS